MPLNNEQTVLMVVAGTGCPGPVPNTLDHPHGIFVDEQLNLYVADTDNNRIQLFSPGQTQAMTVAGFGAKSYFILNRPTDIALDADGYLYIVESQNYRIIRSMPNGFRCLVGCSVVCNPICDSDQLCSSSNDCTCPSGSTTSPCAPQSTGLCSLQNTLNAESIVSITFGAGASQYSSATPADFQFSTTYTQAFSDTLSYGSFAFANAVPAYHAGWQGNASDHTPNDDTGSSHGYMMIIDAKVNADEIFRFTADSLCIGLTYQFSFYVANLIKSPNNYIKPSIKFEVRTLTAANTLLATLDSGDIAEFNTLTWQRYGLLFVATTSSVVLLAISNTPGGSGNDLAIDDISLIVC
ncbi:unnamed protein product [Rotaria sp. Silwood1]|nr:unnamed protein product [Rotaria sp. Silwood1]CAF1660242.1 unnamed protein product [Rotaria sp. Silwood1]CAF4873470.1 unnamed protein product [Rotaria sp. Silwood1]